MTLHNETTAAAEVQRPAYILSNESMLSLSEYTSYSEGDNWLWFVEDGKPVGGFWSIAEEVARATAADAIHLRSGKPAPCWPCVPFTSWASSVAGKLTGGWLRRKKRMRSCLICLSKWIQSFSRRIWKPCRRSGWPVYWPSWGLLCPGRRRI